MSGDDQGGYSDLSGNQGMGDGYGQDQSQMNNMSSQQGSSIIDDYAAQGGMGMSSSSNSYDTGNGSQMNPRSGSDYNTDSTVSNNSDDQSNYTDSQQSSQLPTAYTDNTQQQQYGSSVQADQQDMNIDQSGSTQQKPKHTGLLGKLEQKLM